MKDVIFVVGGKHSGTTLTATILGANSKCSLITMETGAYSRIHIEQTRVPFINYVKSVESDFVVEKTPDHVYQIDKIRKDWPDSPIFIVSRNPIDRVASTMRRHGDWGQSIYECSNDMSACIYGLNYNRTYLVMYEDIVKNFVPTVQGMCDFAGLTFENSMINFHENSPLWYRGQLHDEHHNVRSKQMRTPLYDDSGWGIDYLTKEQVAQVEFDCMEKYQTLLSK
jgi:Sulfotransferase family